MPRELWIGLLVVALLAVGIGVLFAGGGGKLSPQEQAYLSEMEQLRDFLGPVNDQPFDAPLPEHQYKVLKDQNGDVIGAVFLHFDKPVGQDRKILYIGDAVPGKFCNTPEVQELIKKGYVHFHTTNKVPTPDAGHGGKGGEPGFWLRHIAVAPIPKGDMMAGTGVPWGPVKPGIDFNFMPTPPPDCP